MKNRTFFLLLLLIISCKNKDTHQPKMQTFVAYSNARQVLMVAAILYRLYPNRAITDYFFIKLIQKLKLDK